MNDNYEYITPVMDKILRVFESCENVTQFNVALLWFRNIKFESDYKIPMYKAIQRIFKNKEKDNWGEPQ